MIYQLFPRTQKPTEQLIEVFRCFEKNADDIASELHNKLESNAVLNYIADDLHRLGFKVESGKKKEDKIAVPVLYGINRASKPGGGQKRARPFLNGLA